MVGLMKDRCDFMMDWSRKKNIIRKCKKKNVLIERLHGCQFS